MKLNPKYKEPFSIVTIVIAVLSLLLSFYSTRVAYQAKNAQFSTSFSVDCSFPRGRGYLLDKLNLRAPVECIVINLSGKPISLVNVSAAINYKDHGNPDHVELESPDMRDSVLYNMALVVPQGEVKTIMFTGELEPSETTKEKCEEHNNMEPFELLKCSGVAVSNERDFLKQVLGYGDGKDPQFVITFESGDKIEEETVVRFPFSNTGAF